MTRKTATRQNTRSALIETGIDIMLEKGYNNTGLSEVLNTCGVPKGSFYYYFQSKEDFGLQIINTFDEHYVAQLDAVLNAPGLTPIERLEKYMDDGIDRSKNRQCSRGCLIANLSQEMADQNEAFRSRLNEIVLKRRQAFALCLLAAKSAGEISEQIDTTEAAEFFLCGWEGAIMRAKVMKSTEPMCLFKKQFLQYLGVFRP